MFKPIAWLARVLPQERRTTFKDPDGWFLEWLIGGSKTTSGEPVGPKTALKVVAYLAGMRAICEDVASAPFILYRRKSAKERERATNHPLYTLLHDAPNPEMGAMSFRETLTQHAINRGNGYAEIVRFGGRPRELWPVDPERVRVLRDENKRIVYDITQPSGVAARRLQMDDVFHLHGLGYDGLIGYALAQLAAEDLGASLAAVKGAANQFGSGGRPGGVLKAAKRMEEVAVERLRKQWEAMYTGAGNAGRTAILEEGMDFQPISATNKDSQYLELQMYLVEVMARLLRVPPSKIGHNVHGRYSNTEQQAIDYVGDAVRPWAVRWEQEVWRKLILPSEKSTYFAEHLLDGLMRGDSAARSERQKALFYMGALSINDIRAMENMNPIEGGDTYFIQVNLQPLDKALNPPEPPPVQSVGTSNEPDEEDAPAEDDNQRKLIAALVISQRSLFVDAYTRLFALEADKVTKAAKRRGFAEWRERFYETRADYVRKELITPINTFCTSAWRTSGGGVMPQIVTDLVGTQPERLAARYVERSKRELLTGPRDDWTPEAAAERLADAELDTLAEVMAHICVSRNGKQAVSVC